MRSISHCLNQQLVDICQRSVQLEELSNKLSQWLPTELVGECQVGSFNKGCLILITSNAAWASQIRYLIPELRDKLRTEAGLYQLSSIKVSVVIPPLKPKKPIASKKHLLSEKAKASIISESQNCHYEPLQKALLNLADNVEQSDSSLP